MRILCTCAAYDHRCISVALVRALSSERQIEPSKNWRIEVTVFNVKAKNAAAATSVAPHQSLPACAGRGYFRYKAGSATVLSASIVHPLARPSDVAENLGYNESCVFE